MTILELRARIETLLSEGYADVPLEVLNIETHTRHKVNGLRKETGEKRLMFTFGIPKESEERQAVDAFGKPIPAHRIPPRTKM